MKNSPRWLIALALLGCANALTRPLRAADFYVAPRGSDSGDGSPQHPFATLEKARDAARQSKVRPNASRQRVLLRGGKYFLPRAVELDARDNGLSIEASPGEKVILSGGRAVTNWKLWHSKILRADLSALGLSDANFRELYFGGTRQNWARVPNFDPKNPRRGGYLFNARTDSNESTTKVQYRAGELVPAKWTHTERAVMVFHDSLNYEETWAPLKSVDAATRTLEATRGVYNMTLNCPYYICGLLEELDAPGEWYADADSKTLYFWPPNGDPNRGQVVVPVLDSLISFRGSEAAPAENLTLRGVSLRACRGEALQMKNARGGAVLSCDIADVGIAISIGDNTQKCRVVGCDITQTQGDAIRVAGTALDHETISDHVIDNNSIWDFGWGAGTNHCSGVFLERGARLKVLHNRIHDGPRYAIGMGVIQDSEIAYNDCHFMNQTTADTGIIEANTAFDWDLPMAQQVERNRLFNKGNHIHHNVLHDSGGWGLDKNRNYTFPQFSWGIYLDLYSSYWRVDSNIVWSTILGGLMLNCGQNNVVENNIFTGGKESQVQFNPWPKYVFSGNRCERNIIAYDAPANLYTLNNFEAGSVQFDKNLVWCRRSAPRISGIAGLKQKDAWSQWQAMGQDVNSRLGDPLFVNAAQHDYRLEPDSPALKLGFVPIDLRGVGLYASAERPRVRPEAKVLRLATDYTPEVRLQQAVRRDYEDYAIGENERNANVGTEAGKGGVGVTDETAASGKHSLKITDGAEQKNAFSPYIAYGLDLESGALHAGFDLRWEKGALFVYEWRDDPYKYNLGPNLSTDAEGNLSANGKRLLQLPAGQWVRFDIDCALGDGANGTYNLTVKLPNEKPQVFKALNCSPQFSTLTGVVIMSLTDGPSVFYLDNVEFQSKP